MLKEGIHKISSEEYYADPCIKPSLSRSILNRLLKSPIKAWYQHPRLNPDCKEDDGGGKFDIGSAAHSILLEGTDNVEIIEAENWRTKAAKEKRDEAREQGKTPLLESQYNQTILMVMAAEKQILACSDLGIKSLKDGGGSELTFIWSETDAVERKSYHRIRPDWMSDDRTLTIDYKTTGTSADPNDYLMHIFKMGYDIQEAYYRRGTKAVTAIDSKFVFIVQETEEPYLCSFIGLSPEYQNMGHEKVEQGIFMWNQCMKSNNWPGYPNKVAWVDPPPWALVSWEQKSMEMGV